MAFMKGDETLHLGITPNARRRYELLRQRSTEDAGVAELMTECTHIDVQPMDSALYALVGLKALAQDLCPRLQNSYRPWQNYVYLAINAYQYPFIRITQDTNDDWLYLGPFRDRFFLADVLDSISKILKLPHCETGDWPCDKLDEGLCSGWCLGLDSQQDKRDRGSGDHSLEKLDELLKESFLHPNNGILEMVKHERDKYFNDLEFEKADLFDTEIALLETYRDWLNFLYVARNLSFEEGQLLVEDGKIRRCRYLGKDYLFPPDMTQYRDNERLAINLDSLDEARIIYEYFQNKT